MPPHPRAWIEIDPVALEHNLTQIQARLPQSKIMAVIKADAYGHGLNIAAKALRHADEFGVTDFVEALTLREIDAFKAITVLSGDFTVLDLLSIDAKNIRPVVFSSAQVAALDSAKLSEPLHVWLKVDTGMGRLGFNVEQIQAVASRLDSLASVASISLMTHLANADDIHNQASAEQVDTFLALSKSYDWRDISILNSGGVYNGFDAKEQIIRPGLMLYGASPMLSDSDVAETFDLRPAMTFKARVISVNKVAAGTTIGYGSGYIAESETNIACISCGYADGYPRNLPHGTPVFINGHIVPLVGRVSMDLITVDIQGLPIAYGDIATLWGQHNPVELIAGLASTIAYDLLVGVTPRVHRKITNGR